MAEVFQYSTYFKDVFDELGPDSSFEKPYLREYGDKQTYSISFKELEDNSCQIELSHVTFDGDWKPNLNTFLRISESDSQQDVEYLLEDNSSLPKRAQGAGEMILRDLLIVAQSNIQLRKREGFIKDV